MSHARRHGTRRTTCGNIGGKGGNQNDVPATAGRVRSMPLSNRVSVMSGKRPPTGVALPRCVRTTLEGNPNRPKKG